PRDRSGRRHPLADQQPIGGRVAPGRLGPCPSRRDGRLAPRRIPGGPARVSARYLARRRPVGGSTRGEDLLPTALLGGRPSDPARAVGAGGGALPASLRALRAGDTPPEGRALSVGPARTARL